MDLVEGAHFGAYSQTNSGSALASWRVNWLVSVGPDKFSDIRRPLDPGQVLVENVFGHPRRDMQ